jgi:hypothetical protein
MGVKYTLPFSPDEVGLAEAVFGFNKSLVIGSLGHFNIGQ